MTSPTPAAPAVAKKRRTGTKILIGCGLFLALCLLVVLGLVVAGGYWLASPGTQVPTSVVTSPRSVGRVRLENAGGDAGVRELMGELFQAVREAQQEQQGHAVPEWLERMQALHAAQSGQQLEMWLPSEATLSLEPQGEGDGWVAALNFKHFVRPIAALVEHLLANEKNVRRVMHDEHQVYVLDQDLALCFAGGTLLMGQPLEALTSALERADDFDPKASPAPAAPELPGDWDLQGSFLRAEEARALALLLGKAGAARADESDEADWEEGVNAGLERARFGLDVKTGDELRASVEFTYATPEAARAAERAWSALLERAQERALADELLLTATRELHDRSLRLRAGLTGLKAAVPRHIRRSMARSGRADAHGN